MSAKAKAREASPKAPPARARAKLFRNGRSQAVRLPKEFRMPGSEVLVEREGELVILRPVRSRNGWPAGYWEKLERLMAPGNLDFELPQDPIPREIPPGRAR